ncbi:MAG: hypothetical protein WC833_14260 [Bacteroidales bacterium]
MEAKLTYIVVAVQMMKLGFTTFLGVLDAMTIVRTTGTMTVYCLTRTVTIEKHDTFCI